MSGSKNRRNGHSFERTLAKYLRESSEIFASCKTSREASRLYDNCKIDLWGIPILIQAKYGQQKAMNPASILRQMESMVDENFPKKATERELLKCVVHKKPTGRGKKADKYDTLVFLSFEDFIELFIKANT